MTLDKHLRSIGLEWVPTFERLGVAATYRVEPAPDGVRNRGLYDDEWLLRRGLIRAADLTVSDASTHVHSAFATSSSSSASDGSAVDTTRPWNEGRRRWR